MRVWRVAGAAVLVVVLAVGCGRPAPTVSSSPTVTPAPDRAGSSPGGTTLAPTASPTRSANPQRLAAGFVVLTDTVAGVVSDIRYAGSHNFVGRPIVGYDEPLCLVTRQAADALRRVQAAATARRKSLKMYDCYRPRRAAEEFVTWARRPDDQRMKAEFYPTLAKSRLFTDGYIATPADHSRGSTVDLTLVDVPTPTQRPYAPGEPLVSCTAPRGQRFPDNTIDMGTGFDCFDPLSHTAAAGISASARANRQLLKELMTAAGFVNYAGEWWHYRLAGEPYPETYFDFPVAR